ncbi:H(+)/Cl(-) exchange transporter ClcA [archaeon HR01]|nr:H(+)/Cl(-) exchange transporter ClcA [archaeon HR01]
MVERLLRLAEGLLPSRGYLRKWVPIAIAIGVVASLAAIGFTIALQLSTSFFLKGLAGFTSPSPAGEGGEEFTPAKNLLMIPLVTALGGLVSGILVYTFAPEAEGHGTDAAVDAFHNKEGVIRARVPLLKIIASAVTIGSGGSAGREGPIALTSAGFASVLGKLLRMSPSDRRTALAAGLGAGIGAIFKAPLGAAILAGEILYREDFEVQALVPAFISSVIGYSVYASVFGWQPIFISTGQYTFHNPANLVFFGLLGVVCGLVGIVYVKSFYRFKRFFTSLDMPKQLKPALGGLALGVLGIFFPQILGTGYGWLQMMIQGDFTMLPLLVLMILVPLKILATSLTVGSGGSGGVFAPSLVIGGMLGGVTWMILDSLRLTVDIGPAPFVIVGMMSFFGGVGKAPIAVILMVSEMTGTYSLLVPSMISTVIAYVVTGRHTIYSSQVRTRAESPAHMAEYTVPLLSRIRVRDVMTRKVKTIRPEKTVKEALKMMSENGFRGIPVVGDGEKLVGMVTLSDVLRVRPEMQDSVKVGEIMSKNVIVTYPDEPLHQVFEKMTSYGIGRLPVLNSPDGGRIVGIVSRSDVSHGYKTGLENLLRHQQAEDH